MEGLRGLAAISVVAWHYLFAFYPALTTGNFGLQHMRFEDNIYGTPLAILFSGTFAVAIFFVLSGFVLTIGFFQTKRADIIKKLASKRYLRLMLPALASILLALAFMKLGWGRINEAAVITSSEWLDRAWHIEGDFVSAFFHGIIGIFIDGKSAYNNVLWTMSTEFIGSFIVFGAALLLARYRYRWVGYLVLGALTFNTWFMAFIIGMAIADAYSSGVLEKLKNRYVVSVALVFGVLLGSYPPRSGGTGYQFMNLHAYGLDSSVIYLTLGASLLVLAVILSKRVASAFQKPSVSVLGKYTFSLYLVHLPVLYVVTTSLFVSMVPAMGYNKAVLVAVVLTVPVLWVVTKLFEKYIDAPSIVFAKRCSEIYANRKQLNMKQQFVLIKEDLQFKWVLFKARVIAATRRTEDLSE